MRLQQEIDFTTLNWVKQELDETLKQARQALEAYAENPEDSSLMRFCATYLHQVQGTLRMVELYGAAMVAEEMERVAHGLLDGQVRNRDGAFEAMLRGTVLLPDYLERLQSGHRDIPIVLLPLLNDLRTCRGEPLLSEGVLFSPDMSVVLPASLKMLERPLPDPEMRATASRLRTHYQAALVKFCRGQAVSLSVAEMTTALEALGAISSEPNVCRLWWIAAALLDCIQAEVTDVNAEVKGVFGKVDREIKRLVETGEVSFRLEPPDEVIKSLLYHIAQSNFSEGRAGEVKRLYLLDQLLASEQEIEQARDALVGRNRAVLDKVSVAIKEDLMRVKDALDLFLRTAHANVEDLVPQISTLDRVSDTLGVLGIDVPRRVVLEQRELLNKMIIGQSFVVEASLLEIAGALLFVEASLDDYIERLGAAESEVKPSASGPDATLELPQAEVRKILDSLMKEVQANLLQIKNDVVAFIESGWEHAKAEQIPRLMDEIAGALKMINLAEASTLLAAMSKFIDVELLQHKRVPSADQMDRLADAVASMEFYLEAAHAQRAGREQILDVTRESLAALGYWPASVDDSPVAVPVIFIPAAEKSSGHLASSVAAPIPIAEHDFSDIEVDMTSLSFAIDEAMTNDSLSSSPHFKEHELTDASLPAIDLPAQNFEPTFEQAKENEYKEYADEIVEQELIALESGDELQLRSVTDIALDGEEDTTGDLASAQIIHDVSDLQFAETQTSQLDPESDEYDIEWIEVEQEVVDAPMPTEAESFQSTASADIDEDIREVFLEEVQEEIDNLRQILPAWKSEPDNFEKLKPIRRSFHTMKGSGRLVGAVALGEFSWKIENMLNRVLDKTVQPGSAVIALLEQAVEALPQLLAGLRGEHAGNVSIASIMSVADQLASGEEAWLKPTEPTRRTRIVRIPIKKPKTHRMDAVPSTSAVELTEPFDITQSILETAADDTPANLLAPVIMPPADRTEDSSSTDLATVDPMMLEILRIEVAGQLQTIFTYLNNCATAGQALPISEELLRAVHTMHGAIVMVEIPLLNPLIGPLEGYLKRLRGVGLAPSETGLKAISDAAQTIEAGIATVDQPYAIKLDPTEITACLIQLRAQLPEPKNLADVFNLILPDEESHEPSEAIETLSMVADNVAELGGSAFEEIPAVADEELAMLYNSDTLLAPNLTTGATDAIDAFSLATEEISAATIDLDRALEDVFLDSEDEDDAPVEPVDLSTADIASTKKLRPEEISLFSAELAELAESLSVPEVQPNKNISMAVDNFIYQPIADDINPDAALELFDMDEDLLDIFVQEGNDILDVADTMMSRLRGSEPEREIILNLQRELHTLKGGARMAGLAPIGDLSHAMESLLENVADGRQDISRVALESLERGFDCLHGLVERVSKRQAIGMPYNTIARFEALVAGKQIPFLLSPVAAPQVAALSPEAKILSVSGTDTPPSTSASLPAESSGVRATVREIAEEDNEDFSRPQHEMIRVRSDLLDNLVNYAGEVSIYRSRLEQQMVGFRFNLQELDQTVFRLREQLRKLELETEAQIIARYQREAEESAPGEFDPLELDRFSTLQQLTRALAESASDLLALQSTLEDLTKQSETLLLQQSRVSSELQEGLMRTRMVPFDSVVPRLRRLIRQTSGELGKRAQLRIEGAQGEMDRNVLDRMTAPLEHMLRNALAHGLETPGERLASGKPEEGTVTIRISREATEVVIKVSDDGKGMDRDAIRLKALERGLLKSEVQLSDRDLFGFVLETGFSTAEKVSKISGRGVGMDVVSSEIKQLGGSLGIDSVRGAGTEFTIRLPFTLAVTQAILVRLGENLFAVPMSSVQGVVRIQRSDLDERLRSPMPIYSYGGDDYHIYELADLLAMSLQRASDEAQLPLLMTKSGDQRAAIRVDAVLGSREVIVKSVGPQISSVPGIFGATIMGDGSVVMILDMAPLVRRRTALKSIDQQGIDEIIPTTILEPAEVLRQPLIMVVDDSITMRKVTSRVLERNDMAVITAKDGLDAVEKLQDRVPDLMLLDIEMPRMDGYELATYMRNDLRLKRIPIIMVTSRTGEKHRQRALDIGVDRYLGKPYQEADLLKNVEETLRLSRAIQ